MSDITIPFVNLPDEQKAIRARCFHPSGSFVEFKKEDVEQSIPDRFEKIVTKYPDRVAVKTRSDTLTYAELNAMANKVARALLERQGRKAQLVAILLEKGVSQLAVMLGVMKAGKFFLILDPTFPKARIASMLEDSRAKLVVTNRQYTSVTNEVVTSGCQVVEWEAVDDETSSHDLGLRVSPKALAFINYTSGSTGEPKGLLRTHRMILHNIMVRTNLVHVCEHDRISLLSSGTSNAITNTFLALLNGAGLFSLDLKKESVMWLADWLSEDRITICPMSSPLFRSLCGTLSGRNNFPDLRIVRLRSEAVYKNDADLYKTYFSPDCVFVTGLSSNETGPLRDFLIDHRSEVSGSAVPVGYAVPEKEILLLDDSGHEVAPGEMGEIAVRSRYLSPGYLRRPQLTKAKFRPDPKGAGERLYLTGDLGVMLPDGCLVYKGRKDFRIKIRGYGVDLKEVELAFRDYPAVADAVVVVRENESREKELVGYFSSSSPIGPTAGELRSFLGQTLADYMIPSAFVKLDSIPLTPHNKVDRNALPPPGHSRPELGIPFSAPRTPLEQELAKIWAEVLGHDQVGVDDNFFDLGGHSLLATQVLCQIYDDFQVDLSLSQFFDTPTIAGLADAIERSRPTEGRTRNLLIQAVSRSGHIPLSFAQQRLWFLDQLEPGGSTYNLFSAYQIKGDLNVTALEQSFNEIIRRHEVLRTVFHSVDGQPAQKILPSLIVKIPVLDLRGAVPEEERQSEVRRLAKEEARRPFDLACGPLLRVTLLRLADDGYVLFRSIHHSIFDGWSGSILFRELAGLYEAFSNGRPSPFFDLPTQYADFSVWQRDRLKGEVLERQLSYWKKQLAGVPALQLPTDRPRPPVQAHCGARKCFVLSPSLTSEIKRLSGRSGATLFMTLLAAFQTLLHRYSAQADFATGAPIAGRNRRETEDLIGFFLNTLVMRADLTGDPSFRELLARTRKVCLDAYAHQDLPFEKLVEEVQPKRDLSRNPLFQVTFAFQNSPAFPPELAGLTVNELEVDTGIARFDLHVFMEEEEKGLRGYFDYDTDLFNADTIHRMLGHFQALLEGIVANPEQRLSDLPFLPEAERHQLLVEWNDTQKKYPKDKCLHQLFEEQVERTPDAVAVVLEDQRLTYRELNSRANQLAHRLRKLGVGPEVLVGICMERSLEMIIGLLGILKAGGAYVPLDPEYPKERLAFMLEDTGGSVLVTQSRVVSQLPKMADDGREDRGQATGDRVFLGPLSPVSGPSGPVIGLRSSIVCLDTDWEDIARESDENPVSEARAENLAYVIYTSGSTGRPKGVGIPHRGVVRLVNGADYADLTEREVFLQFAPLSFDASTFEIWGSLLNGAKLVVFPPHTPSLNELGDVAKQSAVTTLWLTAALFHQIVEGHIESLSGVKQLLAGGDVLSGSHVTQLLKKIPGIRLINGYGPTENTTFTCCHPMKSPEQVGHSVSIGRPIVNTQVYLLDHHLNPVAVGVPGELCIGGDGLARGYLSRPEMTAEKFIPNPFSNEPGTRLYKSGDLARYLPDGNIEFLGRIDHQVKIRGFRIELGEVEATLRQHAAVRETVVIAREDIGSADRELRMAKDGRDDPKSKIENLKSAKRLVAYVVSKHEPPPAVSELRSFLKEKLPDYLVPSAFVFLDALPLTPNGKVDRKALPEPDQTRPDLEQAFVAPRTPDEESLAGIWSELLGLERVGIHDDFFELGGHSLLATQVVSRVREGFQVELPLQSLFENPTVAGLAGELKKTPSAEYASKANSAILVSQTQTRPLSFAQQRLWFIEQLEPNTALYNIPEAFRVRGPVDVIALQQSINEIVRRHEVLRTRFATSDGQPVQIVLRSLILPLSVIDLSDRPESEREAEALRLAYEEAHRPFDLARGPLLRSTLLRLGQEDHVLLLTMHHIVSDGWSLAVFFRELAAFYVAFSKKQRSPLAELPLQYTDYAQWQREWLQGEVLQRQLDYWKKQIEGVSTLELPTDHPRPAVQSYRGASQSIVLPKELTYSLKTLSQGERVTLFMSLLAAFKVLLYRYTGQQDIVVGAPIAGRNRVEHEGLIGFFVNTLVLRSDLSGDPTFREFLRRVRNASFGAYDNQDLPFEKLVEELQPRRDLSRNPLFQVLFQLKNLPEDRLRLSNTKTEEFPVERNIAKFDLTLEADERKEGLCCKFGYNTDLFNAFTIRRMQGHFRTLLESIVANPNCKISGLRLLIEAEQHPLPADWDKADQNFPSDKCVQQSFEEEVEKTPEAVAVVFPSTSLGTGPSTSSGQAEDQQLTYRELNRRANQLAHYLQNLGVGPEVLVGICMERSLEMIVALLGVLKAGGAYVPLDPESPRERLEYILRDTCAPILLTQERFASEMQQYKTRVVCLDSYWETLRGESEQNPAWDLSDCSLAYAIYTSGSTGRPKAVTVEHRQLFNYSTGILRRLSPSAGSSFAMVQPLTFDSCITVIFSALLSGGSLHMIPREEALSPTGLGDYFSRRPIDFLKIAPSHFSALQGSVSTDLIMPRRCLVLGGEESRWDWIKSLQTLAPGCGIVNHYGPTEATVGVMTYQVEDNSGSQNYLKIPLERPLANTQVYLLGPDLQPVPAGVLGEIYIGGANVARGYLNCPELTAEKFIPDPFSKESGARLYKSGDLARHLPDGKIEFLGRIDYQVKIRGNRIELGEIEAALSAHPDIQKTAVLSQGDGAGEKHLVAYVVPKKDRSPTIAGKPRYRLPNGMAVAQLNKNETDYMYQEIFERQAYLRHGITINDGDCIFDVGANIGLFTVFANQIAKSPRIYSFEPGPAVHDILKANAELYGSDVRLFKYGLSDKEKTTTFTFFPGFSLLSGFYADAQAEKAVVKTFMINQQRAGVSEMGELLEQADDVLDQRFSPQTFSAHLRTLSSVIEQEKVQCIDLLKINVEKSEWDVLRGIRDADWKKIKQIVLEVDVQENLQAILSLLDRHGFESVVEQDVLLENTQLCYVYAIRPSKDRRLVKEQQDGTHFQPTPVLNNPFLSIDQLRSFLKEKLPDYMVPSAFVLLDALPLTPNGKVDRHALPAPDQTRPDLEEAFAAPRTPTEKELAKIWAEILKVDKVGVRDNFFNLGGHSLLATQLVSRIRDAFRIELSLRTLFEAPTVADLAERLEAVRGNGGGVVALPILPEVIDGDYPLSFAQERFWFLNQLEPNNLAYSVSHGFRLTGPLDIEALERSLAELVQRHETLRTTFQPRNGKPLQTVSGQWSFRMSVLDLSRESAVDLDTEVQRLFEDERRRPFDLSTDLLLRATLLRLSADEHVLFLNSHHIAWDHWCIELFFRELSALYQAFTAGQPSPLARLPIQYKDYALWQRNVFQSQELESHLAYWKQQLSGAPPGLNLPTDCPRKPLKNRRGGRQSMLLPNSLSDELRILGRKADASLFMTLLAAFQTLLHRMTGQGDIVVGTPVAGRDRSETEGLIGLFLNSLALRTDLSGNPTFLELLTRVREVALGAYDHQELPFEKLVEELQPERDLTQTPVFQVFINMYNFKEAGLELGQLSAKSIKASEQAPQFDIEFYIREHDDGTRLTFAYDSDLFAAATIARMLGHFQVLLRAVVSDPDRRLSDLPILTDAEKHQLLLEWNDTRKDYLRDKCLHQLFEEQAERTPDAVAVVFPSTVSGPAEDQRLTYRELNRRANQLAHYLRKLGVGPEVLVGICMERSLEMVVGLLGILKAGGAYVPLDPAYPKERLAFMLDDSKATVLLTQGSLLAGLPEHKARVVCLDSDWEGIAREDEENPAGEVKAGNLAYLIYTSGSTGKPKGVAIEHHSTTALLHWAKGVFAAEDLAGVLASTSVCFDLSIFELFVPLSCGGKIILAENALQLPTLSAAGEVTLINTVPSAITELLGVNGLPGSVRTVNLAGEPLQTSLVEQLYRQETIQQVFDLYGPSEDTTYSTFALRSSQGPATIGRPIANTQVYLLDTHLNPVPIGLPGELYIGGDGLARGYLDRPELTAERFIPNPFSDKPGDRLYKTGDLARYLPDGNIEFLGRIDHQVKIRGFRIELGEIEAALRQHPAVRETVVLAREDEQRDPSSPLGTGKLLVAYVVPKQEQSLSINELRSFLKRKLPDYMVPSAFVFLDRLPLTPSGKVDRQALPAPDQSRPDLEKAFVAPRTPGEETLAGIWSELLGVEQVGVHDDFFELGGHSLLATQVISRIRETFQIEIHLRALFENPTVAGLATHIRQIQSSKAVPKKLADVLDDVESLSDEEAERLLAQEREENRTVKRYE